MLAPPYTHVHLIWHKMGNRSITLIFNILNNTTFTDTYSCYLLYRRTLFESDKLITNGWDQHAEILSRALKKAKTVYEVPVTYRGHGYAEGKKIRAADTFSGIGAIIRFRWFA